MTDDESPSSARDYARRTARASLKMWLGVFFGIMAAILAVGALVFIWFGFFPGLVFILLCLPVAALALHFVRAGKPPHTA